jgi:hypothetical protein
MGSAVHSRHRKNNPNTPPHLKPSPIEEALPLTSVTMGPGSVMFPKIIDDMEMSYSYHLLCDQLLQSVSEEVEITAVVENPGLWGKSYLLVPLTTGAGGWMSPFLWT